MKKEYYKSIIELLDSNDIKRINNSNKEYIHFIVSVFNTGAVVRIKLSDYYKEYNDGYSFVISNENYEVENINNLYNNK